MLASPEQIHPGKHRACRGRAVELVEAGSRLGGKILPGSAPAVKFDFKCCLDWVREQNDDAAVFAVGA